MTTFHDNINKCVSESFYPDDLKRAKVIPIFKKDIEKDSKNLKEDYRPLSIPSNISKIYETYLNYPVILKIFFQIISSAFVKVLVLSNALSLLLKPGKNTLITMSLLRHY